MTMTTIQAPMPRTPAGCLPDAPHSRGAELDAEPFDIEAALARLPPSGLVRERGSEDDNKETRGYAGQRLRAGLRANCCDGFLRDIAHDTLGAVRCSQKYLDALRIVLGNQAHAERFGYLLEMNTRTTFTSEKVMRTILGQLEAAGITFKKQVILGQGRAQAVHCFRRRLSMGELVEALRTLYRLAEGEDRSMHAAIDIATGEVPY